MADSNEQLTYLCGGEIDSGEFSLSITSDDLDPQQITELLGIQPAKAHRRGDFIGETNRTFNFGRWSYSTGRLDFRSGKSCEESFDDFLRCLPSNTAIWESIAGQHETQVFIYLWMRTWNREFDISTFALGELARRKLRLHVDTYLEDEDDN